MESIQPALFYASRLESALLAAKCEKCSPMDLYTDLFRLGEGYIQTSKESPGEFKTNPIIIGHNKGRQHRKILFEDTFAQTLEEFSDYEWAFVSACTYYGRVNSAERQGKIYGFIFDLDDVDATNVKNFFSGAYFGLYPIPNYVVESGHGLHLYFMFDEPIDLYPNIKTQLKDLKYTMTRRMWNQNTSGEENVQYQGINQAFRIPGGRTKIPGVRTQAWRVHQKPHTIEELAYYISYDFELDMDKRFPTPRMSLEQAKEKYPEWYERIIVRKEPKGQWVVKPALYEWWLRTISEGKVSYGHRYFCIMALAIYAAKCGIYDREKVRADAVKLIDHMNAAKSDKPFTETDIDSALECLDARYVRFPRHDIEKLTGFNIAGKKRNGRKRSEHLRIARAIRDISREMSEEGPWWINGGRPKGSPNKKYPKRDAILSYAAQHPHANHSEIAKALGISRPTVIKWLREAQ